MLPHRTTIAVQESLEHGEANIRRVEQVHGGHELGVRVGAGEIEVTQYGRDRVREPPRPPPVRSEDVVDRCVLPERHAVQGHVERGHQLCVRRREARRGRRREAAIAEQEPERIGVHRDGLGQELRRGTEQRKLEPALVMSPQASDHVDRLEHPTWLAVSSIIEGADEPQVLATAHGRRRRPAYGRRRRPSTLAGTPPGPESDTRPSQSPSRQPATIRSPASPSA